MRHATGRQVQAYRRMAAGALLAPALLAFACDSGPPTVLEPVFRLTDHRAVPRERNVSPRCNEGGEIRPSLGCPPFHFLKCTLEKQSNDRVRLEARPPAHLRGKELAVLPTIRIAPGTPTIALPLQIVDEAGQLLSLSLPFQTEDLKEKSRAQLRVHVLEPLEQRFSTTELEIPKGAELTVGIAVSGFAEESGAGATEFRLEAHGEDGGRELLRETLLANDGGRWFDHRVDLSDLAGKQIRFDFIATTKPSADRPHSTAAYPLWGAPEILAPRPRDGRRNLVLISLDTVRADYLGATRNGSPLTPWFDRLSSEGSTFRQALSTFSSTSASHMSLFTGAYPARHQVRFATHRLPEAIPTLPQILAGARYSTAAVTENAMILAGSGFARGFDFYRENRDLMKKAGASYKTFSDGIAWLEKHRGELFFLFLHTYEAHAPYTPTDEALAYVGERDPAGVEERLEKWEGFRRRYAAEVHYADRALERLFEELGRLDLLDDTLVVVTSDHGEEFGEHGLMGHAKTVYDEVLRIPLLFWAPGHVPSGRVVEQQVSLVDVVPTILELLELPPPSEVPGQSLVSAMQGDPMPGDGVRFAEGLEGSLRLVTARTSKYKWIWKEGEAGLETYDLGADPDELAPIDDPQIITRGRELIESYLSQGDAPEKVRERDLDQATRQKLEALGYVE